MPTPLLAQEIHLLERYSSKAYFGAMRDAWERMLRHAERCLEAFVAKLPPDYRDRPLPEQPDIVWGERILPNFRNTADSLNNAYIRLTHGEMQALGVAAMVRSDFSGFSRDYSSDWMDEPQVLARVDGGGAAFWRWLALASQYASNIEFTEGAYWTQGALTHRYNPDARGPLDPPSLWRRYVLSATQTAQTGEPVTRTGIYLPRVDDSCAAFMIEGLPAPPASIGYDPETMQNTSEAECSWRLVEGAEEGSIEDGLADLLSSTAAAGQGRMEAGQTCPRSGWWYSPAKSGARRHFNRGDTFPSVDSDYGGTFWLWAQDQSPPSL
ncbi:hypothetical protein QFW77_10910 [Luteimonas sp. RD2P54]|uniref:Uncharacterized protein n=1 Tax=Luteimonas endophytica TaxID=3042023 RepID=A0ABT6J9J0_9GAMM|nr:hypothetical protein [Luteimonas endophytica]MDH5823495.1 hypothetical protein [Luteimonas endophytica]